MKQKEFNKLSQNLICIVLRNCRVKMLKKFNIHFKFSTEVVKSYFKDGNKLGRRKVELISGKCNKGYLKYIDKYLNNNGGK